MSVNLGVLSAGRIPRVRLGVFPTPLHRLERISQKLNKNVYMKRDDLCGVALGGNKVRKLEYLLWDAMERGCDTVLTTGGAQSNHAMLTAACCNRLGLSCVLVLKKRGVTGVRGNLLLDDLLGAEVEFVDSDSYDDVYARMERLGGELAKQGRKAYRIPVGGSVARGSLGYAAAVEEIAAQTVENHVRLNDIVCCTGSGGTHAGLLAAAGLYLPETRVTGISVDPAVDFFEEVRNIANGTARLLGSDRVFSKEDVHLHDCSGGGYAVSSPQGESAMRLMAGLEGIFLDPVYTAKAFAGLLELHAAGYFEGRENLLFLHSGGAGGIFALDRYNLKA